MNLTAWLRICCGIAALALSSGCAGKPENAIVGKWKAARPGRGTMQFLQDGTLIADGKGAKYSFPDAPHIRLDAPDGSAAVWGCRIDGDRLFLTNDNVRPGKPLELDRVKE